MLSNKNFVFDASPEKHVLLTENARDKPLNARRDKGNFDEV